MPKETTKTEIKKRTGERSLNYTEEESLIWYR